MYLTNGSQMNKKRFTKGSLKEGVIPKLTKTEKEILRLSNDEYLTPKQISIRRGTSNSFTYKIIRNIKQKGAFSNTSKKVHFSGYTSEPFKKGNQPLKKGNQIRLHGQVFHIKLIYKDHRYMNKVNNNNILSIDGNTIRIHKDTLIIYSNKDFFAENAQRATINSMSYWTKFFHRLEDYFNIIIVKHRKENINLVKHHYAELNNELVEQTDREGDKIKIYATEDGKLWAMGDKSKLYEFETQHRHTAEQDMQETVAPFFNDLRDKKPLPKLSEIWGLLSESIKHEREMAAGLSTVVEVIKRQYPKPETKEPKEIIEKPSYVG